VVSHPAGARLIPARVLQQSLKRQRRRQQTGAEVVDSSITAGHATSDWHGIVESVPAD
jgi:hypothetical protein